MGQGQTLAIYNIGEGPGMDLRAQGTRGGHIWIINPKRAMPQRYKQVECAHAFCQTWIFVLGAGWMCFTLTKRQMILEKASPLSRNTLPESSNEWDLWPTHAQILDSHLLYPYYVKCRPRPRALASPGSPRGIQNLKPYTRSTEWETSF